MTIIQDGSPHGYRSMWLELYDVTHTLGYVDAGGIRTRYLEAGDRSNPTVLCLHGTAGTLENYFANVAPLSQNFHVLAIDMWGCGWTAKPSRRLGFVDWAEHARLVLDAFNVERAGVIGVSLGSGVAITLANMHPDRITGVVMCAPAGITPDRDRSEAMMAGITAQRDAPQAEPTWDTVSQRVAMLVADPATLAPDLIALRLGVYSSPEMKAAQTFVIPDAEGVRGLTDQEWAELSVPVLAIAAVDSDNLFLTNAYRIGEIGGNARVLELTDCDHWPQYERAETFNAAVTEFFTEAFS